MTYFINQGKAMQVAFDVIRETGGKLSDIYGSEKGYFPTMSRHVFIYILFYCGWSKNDIAQYLRLHHTTIIYAVRRVENDQTLRAYVKKVLTNSPVIERYETVS